MTQQTVQTEPTPTASVAPPAASPVTVTAPIADTPAAPPAIAPTKAVVADVQTTRPNVATIIGAQSTPATNFARAAEMQWKIFQANNEWIRFADLKAGALLTANGALLAAGLSALKSNADFLHWYPLALGLALFSGAALLTSVGYCLASICPKTTPFHNRHDRETNSLLFTEHIAQFDKDEHHTRAQALGDDEATYNEISQQVWINARVARAKNQQVRYAVMALAVSIGGALLAALVALFR